MVIIAGLTIYTFGVPTADSVSPSAAARGASITITGGDFNKAYGYQNGTLINTFNTPPLYVIFDMGGSLMKVVPNTRTSTVLTCTVPNDIAENIASCVVRVGVVLSSPHIMQDEYGAGSGTGPTLTLVNAPVILGFTPAVLMKGVPQSLAISGRGFGPSTGTGRSVTLGATPLTNISSWTDSAISVQVPSTAVGFEGDAMITVNNAVGSDSQTIPIETTVPPEGGSGGGTPVGTPAITSNNPDPAKDNQNVTLNGTDFGTARGQIRLYSGSSPITISTISYWGNTNVIFMVPINTVSCNVELLTSTGLSSGLYWLDITTSRPEIVDIDPETAVKGRPVNMSVTGEDFGYTQGQVRYGSYTALITYWSNSLIRCQFICDVTKNITVFRQSDAQVSDPVEFVVTLPDAPVISRCTPSEAVVGQSVEVTGSNFGTSGGELQLNGEAVDTDAWSATSISFKVPDGSVTGYLKVVRDDDAESNEKPFSIKTEQTKSSPTITELRPSSGLIKSTVQIVGTNFGVYEEGLSFVYLGTVTVPVTPTNWKDTSITVTVPATMASGVYYMQVKNPVGPSNSVKFIVTTTEPPKPPDPPVKKILPYIDRIVPGPVAAAETKITIFGRDFGGAVGQVKFGSTSLEIVTGTWTNSSVQVTLTNQTGRDFIYVINKEGESNKVAFIVSPPLPKITSIVPAVANFGDDVVIFGENFKDDMTSTARTIRTGYGTFKTVLLENIVYWTDTEIKFKPYDTTDFTRGELRIIVDDLASNWAMFGIDYGDVSASSDRLSLADIRNQDGQLISVAPAGKPPILNVPANSATVKNLSADKFAGHDWEDLVAMASEKLAIAQGLLDRLSTINNIGPDESNNIAICGANGINVISNPAKHEIIITTEKTISDAAFEEVLSGITAIEHGPGMTVSIENGVARISLDFGMGANQVAPGNHSHDAEPATYA